MTALVVLHVGDTAINLTGWGLLVLLTIVALLGGSR